MTVSTSSDIDHIQEVELQRQQGGYASLYFASVVIGLMALFATVHWIRQLRRRLRPRKASRNIFATWHSLVERSLHGSMVYGIQILPERVAMAVIYFGTNIGVSVWDIDWHHYTTFANRLGWVALCNMCLAIFLALKNTPLSPIAGRSYESINVLHRWCGVTTILLTIVHAAIYAAGLFRTEYAWLLTFPGTIAADVAGIAMLLILLTANGYVRRRHYEFFYIVHNILIVISLITVCFHTSKAARHSLYIALIATSVYTLDRVLRFTRLASYLPSNTAILTPLKSCNATRVTLSGSMAHAAPGSHAFLYLPSIRAFQIHPFTMINRDPVQFVISAREGFTKDLFKAACEKPGQAFKAGMEGAYGHVPDLAGYDRVVLFAGGSGATFAFALAIDWAGKHDGESKESLDLIWSVRTLGHLEGFVSELAVLEAHPRISMRVHVTKLCEARVEKSVTFLAPPVDKPQVVELETKDVKTAPTTKISAVPLPAYAVPGRPDVHSAVRRITSECEANQRILVAACGPGGLSTDVRSAVKDCIRVGGPFLDLHQEAFGW